MSNIVRLSIYIHEYSKILFYRSFHLLSAKRSTLILRNQTPLKGGITHYSRTNGSKKKIFRSGQWPSSINANYRVRVRGVCV